MQFYGAARQDEFTARILNFKKNGYFLDIGSNDSIGYNNSYFFDNQLDWKGICVEIETSLNHTYHSRKNTLLINSDATKVDYLQLLSDNNFPTTIDYLSLDVDAANIEVLKILPLDKFIFSVITIEHDGYLYGNLYRSAQREVLQEHGYLLLCSNVNVEQDGFYGQKCPFEDWWVHSSLLQGKNLADLLSDDELPSQIIAKFLEKEGI